MLLSIQKSILYKAIRNIYRNAKSIASLWKRELLKTDERIIETYLNIHEVRKLHIGCGSHPINGFINADLSFYSDSIIYLDATRRFPFKDESFDYIFSEHMIEHISYTDGLNMLSECHRILKRNGKIRISTPNIKMLLDLGKESRNDLQNSYISWSIEHFSNFAPRNDSTFVINNFFRDWGHQFIYSEKTLASSLEKSGFSGVKLQKINESDYPELSDLENEERMPSGFLALETLTLEATK